MAPKQITHDYYYILRVKHDASPETIKASYRKIALKNHPDKNPAEPKATARFQLIQEAYDCLSNPTARKAYDVYWPSIAYRSPNSTPRPRPQPPRQPTFKNEKSCNEGAEWSPKNRYKRPTSPPPPPPPPPRMSPSEAIAKLYVERAELFSTIACKQAIANLDLFHRIDEFKEGVFFEPTNPKGMCFLKTKMARQEQVRHKHQLFELLIAIEKNRHSILEEKDKEWNEMSPFIDYAERTALFKELRESETQDRDLLKDYLYGVERFWFDFDADERTRSG